MGILDRFQVVLLDLNGTFMFGEDRFGPSEDFAATYHRVGGGVLTPQQVEGAIRACYGRMASDYQNPAKYDDFPQVAEVLQSLHPKLPGDELDRLEQVIAVHELGQVPDAYADCLRRLARTHWLGLVANIWSKKERWLQELERAGVLGLFRSLVFSSDTASVKPSRVLFKRALHFLGASRSEAVFVGDSLRCDIEGAKAAGLATVWAHPAGTPHPSADHVVGSLLDLLPPGPV